jgi:putative peptide zinc metalloprotease protein
MSGATTRPIEGGLAAQVAGLRPQLRHGVEILVQDYRGDRWYLLHDRSSGHYLRFNATAYEFLGRLDGVSTVDEIIEAANDGAASEILVADDVLQILAQLHDAEVLSGGLPLAVQDLLERYRKAQRHRRRRALSNPLALRIRLFDPDRLLDRLVRPARWLFSWRGLALWSGVVLGAIALAVAHVEEIARALADTTLGVDTLLLFWLLYPIIKALHELGHGLAVKVWGGEVHETGINLLVFMPVPYVDASAAWAFRDKWRRAIVGAAGILVELFIAAFAFIVWLLVEPGLVRDLAFQTTLIAGLSTLLFNGNPLLRFDGYYVLEDLIEVPNLATRSNRHYLHLVQRHLFGVTASRSPATARGETGWFLAYGLLSPLYRVGVMIAIAWYLAGEFLIVGVALALWVLSMQLVRPVLLGLRFVMTSPRLEARRLRAIAVVVLFVLLLAGLVHVPVPNITLAQGVVWHAEQAPVVSRVEGLVVEVNVLPGDGVEAGQLLMRLEAPRLQARIPVLEAKLRELEDARVAERLSSRVRAAMVDDDIKAVRDELTEVRRRVEGLEIRAMTGGRFHPAEPLGLEGRLVRQGETVAYVLEPRQSLVRAVVDQDGIGLLRGRPTSAEVVLADRPGDAVGARIVREVPAGTRELPSAAVGASAGGYVPVDMADRSGRTAAVAVFHVELQLPDDATPVGVGQRVHVRLSHGREALWIQWKRSLRQLFLAHLHA